MQTYAGVHLSCMWVCLVGAMVRSVEAEIVLLETMLQEIVESRNEQGERVCGRPSDYRAIYAITKKARMSS